jgi:hypothetical protein
MNLIEALLDYYRQAIHRGSFPSVAELIAGSVGSSVVGVSVVSRLCGPRPPMGSCPTQIIKNFSDGL